MSVGRDVDIADVVTVDVDAVVDVDNIVVCGDSVSGDVGDCMCVVSVGRSVGVIVVVEFTDIVDVGVVAADIGTDVVADRTVYVTSTVAVGVVCDVDVDIVDGAVLVLMLLQVGGRLCM